MPIRVACTSCGKKLQIRDELAGKKVRCPECATVFLAAAGSASAVKANAPTPSAPKSGSSKADPSRPNGPSPAAARDKVTAKVKPKPPPARDEEDEDDEEMEERRARGKKRREEAASGSRMWFWIVAASVLLVGVAVGVYFVFFYGPSATTVAKINPKAPGAGDQVPGPGKTPLAQGALPLIDLVPGDALAFVSVSGDTWNVPGLEFARQMAGPFEQEFQKHIGFPMADLERATLFTVGGFEEMRRGDMPLFVIVLQTKKPFQEQAVTAALQKAGKAGEIMFEIVSDQTVVLTPPGEAMQRYQAKKGKAKASGVLERALLQASTTKGLTAAATVPPEAVKMAEPGLKDMPPFFAPFLKTKAVLAGMDVTDRLKLDLSLDGGNAAVANELKDAADQMVAFANVMLGAMAKDPEAAGAVKLGRQALKDLKIAVKGNELTLALQADMGAVVQVAMPLVEKIRNAAGAVTETNNLKQIALAWIVYHDSNGTFPPQTFKKGLSWRVAILPYIEQDELYRQFKLDEPWNSPHNIKLVPLMPKVFESAKKAEPGRTYYQTFVGPNTINKVPTQGIKFTQIPDGTSNTIMVAEASRAVEWTKPDDIRVFPNQPIVLGGADPKFVLVGFADGSVRPLPRTLDQQSLRWLIDPADGNAIPNLNAPPGKK
jgi:hypothetical protein